MHFSTSDSEPFALRLWLPVLLISLVLLLGVECFWRSRGFLPGPQDSATLWAHERDRADELGPDAVVLAGTSRIRLGLSPVVLTAALAPYQFVMLAVDGATVRPLLSDLAADERFQGTVLCELSVQLLTGKRALNDGTLEDYIRRRS